MRPLYIFDLDGTLALIEHRLHYIQRPSSKCCDCGGANRLNCVQCSDLDAGWKADWRGFFSAVGDDAPNVPVIDTMRALFEAGARIWIWSGRSDECKEATVKWLTRHGCMRAAEQLRMRKEGDHRPDVDVKAEWLASLSGFDIRSLVAVFDDRASVVKMWRDAGITCFQVAPGEF